ncbi:MAG: GNAT family N-acetyltransferase [Desulforhopalus sp.]|nr:GNAT family N-acetyltransferase [Desulforhopalus sp.]
MVENMYTIRAMTRQEVDLAIDWAAEEGWNPGLTDADCFYAADANGFLLGSVQGKPVATISAVSYGDSFGFIGFYIVKPEYRGQGYGLRIWQAALDHLAGRTIGLDGVVAQQDNYRKSGFVLAYRNIRYQGIGGGEYPSAARTIDLATVPFAEIEAFDAAFFPDRRRDFLQRWLQPPQGAAFGVRGDDGGLAGYGVVRLCRNGYKIGPLFADDPQTAEQLFLALKAKTPAGAALFLDTPAVNPAAIALAARYKMAPAFETARMYKGPAPELPIAKLFGVTTFELG